jgi:hypothetical protein
MPESMVLLGTAKLRAAVERIGVKGIRWEAVAVE